VVDEIFAVVRIDRNTHPCILTAYRTIEELTEYYIDLIQKNRKNVELNPVGIHDGLTFILNDVKYNALELAKEQARERRAA